MAMTANTLSHSDGVKGDLGALVLAEMHATNCEVPLNTLHALHAQDTTVPMLLPAMPHPCSAHACWNGVWAPLRHLWPSRQLLCPVWQLRRPEFRGLRSVQRRALLTAPWLVQRCGAGSGQVRGLHEISVTVWRGPRPYCHSGPWCGCAQQHGRHVQVACACQAHSLRARRTAQRSSPPVALLVTLGARADVLHSMTSFLISAGQLWRTRTCICLHHSHPEMHSDFSRD